MTTAADMLIDDLEVNLVRLAHSLLRAAKPELSRTSTSVLALLRDDGPQRITELAAHEAVAQPSMTSLVSRLERDGLVERRHDPGDRRAVLVAITAEGERVLIDRRRARAAALAARLDRLDDDERRALAAAVPALQKLNSEEDR
jgi:DNA-binding MarR family transcriptional regulator